MRCLAIVGQFPAGISWVTPSELYIYCMCSSDYTAPGIFIGKSQGEGMRVNGPLIQFSATIFM